MGKYQRIRGTYDLQGKPMDFHESLIEAGQEVFPLYGFSKISTPIIEPTALFVRNLGDGSDIVQKEMYTFLDRSENSISLRPEGTAGVIRALIDGGQSQTLPIRVFYHGPMFRYERPQKGRYREFYQMGVEMVGSDSPYADIEVLAMAVHFLKKLGLTSWTLKVNTLGSKADTQKATAALRDYFSTCTLSEDSQRRLEKNPLRILDSKDPEDQKLFAKAPKLKDFLSPQALENFEFIKSGLHDLNIDFQEDPLLVRGLDYYNDFVFEFHSDKLGAQSAFLAGGRYNDLVSELGGPQWPGLGWALGVERLSSLIPEPPSKGPDLAILPVGGVTEKNLFPLAETLRSQGLRIHMDYSGNLSKRIKKANAFGAKAIFVVGPDELGSQKGMFKNLKTEKETSISFSELPKQFS